MPPHPQHTPWEPPPAVYGSLPVLCCSPTGFTPGKEGFATFFNPPCGLLGKAGSQNLSKVPDRGSVNETSPTSRTFQRAPSPDRFTKRPHLLFLLQEILEQFPLLLPEALRCPQLPGGVLLGLLPQAFTLCLREAGHARERLQEQDVHKLLERSHGAAVQLLKPREPQDSYIKSTRSLESIKMRPGF